MNTDIDTEHSFQEVIKIGLVGFGSVGKDTVARYLVDTYGFIHISSGDLVREYIVKNDLGELTRENLQKAANALRENHGADYLTILALQTHAKKAQPGNNKVVISGLRAVPEVTRLKTEGGKILAVTAPAEVRYAWSQKRAGLSDRVTLEQFKETEAREATSNVETSQNIKAVLELADVTLINTGTRDELYASVDEIMSTWQVAK